LIAKLWWHLFIYMLNQTWMRISRCIFKVTEPFMFHIIYV
jgi:hypothetical protein